VFAHILAGGRAAFNLFLAVVLGVLIGGLLATPPDDETAPVTPTTTVAQVTPEEVARLADALEALTTTTVPPAAQPLVDEAEDVLDAVREQELLPSTPLPTPAPPYPPAAPVTTIPTTTTRPPPTTSTTYAHDLLTGPTTTTP